MGNGQEAKLGSRVFVHFECKYRGLYVVSTRSARTLGGNRTVAEVGACWDVVHAVAEEQMSRTDYQL